MRPHTNIKGHNVSKPLERKEKSGQGMRRQDEKNTSTFLPLSSKATPMRLLYMERAVKVFEVTDRAISRLNVFPLFTVRQRREVRNDVRNSERLKDH